MASSKVSSLRVRISSVGRPKVKGSRWKAKMMLEPRLLMTWLTLSFKPRTIDEIPMTTATPITMQICTSEGELFQVESKNDVGTQAADDLAYVVVQAAHDRRNPNDHGHSNHNTQHGQRRAQFVAADGVDRHVQAFAEFAFD